jgi:hypothetical protein
MPQNKMTILDQDELKRLLQQHTGICVSIFMPTHRIRLEKQREDQIRLKNLIREAESQLTDYAPDLTVPEVQQILEPATRLLGNGLFWKQQRDGLAIFLSRNYSYIYRLPLNLKEFVIVAHRIYIRPLLPLLTGNGRYYILALSQNEVRLFQSTRYSITEIETDEVPTSLAEAIADDDPESQLQFHTSTGAIAAAGGRAAAFHGQGVSDEKKSNIYRYFRKVDAGLQELLSEADAPLVLAGVEYLFSIYREANTYPHLFDKGIPGNPETVPVETLHRQAWEIVQPYFMQPMRDVVKRYDYFASISRASDDLAVIFDAARIGRVDTFLVTNHPPLDPRDEDMADLAAGQTLLHGGDVYFVAPDAMPGETSVAAIFRF